MKLICTPGDPGGIGYDLIVLLAMQKKLKDVCVFADKSILEARARLHHCDVSALFSEFECRDFQFQQNIIPGQINAHAAALVARMLDEAVDGVLSGQYAALVTGPIQKYMMVKGGIPSFTGHTEYLAKRAGVSRVVMMLASDNFRVALCTQHIALSEVPKQITQRAIERDLEIIHYDFIRYLKRVPRIAVCGLNPHAGESGQFGQEEITVITPAILRAQQAGLQVFGPFSADTLFCEKNRKSYDVILAMYHDQGLAPLKACAFGEIVNVTLGLPFVRTSVDHGTAYDKVGSADIDVRSFEKALQLARTMSIE